MSEKIEKKIDEYLDRQPYLKKCLSEHLVNKSSLAKKIKNELNIGAFSTIHLALNKIQENSSETYDSAKKIINKSNVEVKTDVLVFIGKNHLEKVMDIVNKAASLNEEIDFLKLKHSWIVFSSKKYEKQLSALSFKKHLNVTKILIQSPPSIEDTLGVLGKIVNNFSNQGINIIEFISCWTNTLILIETKQLSTAMKVLGKQIG